MVKCIDNSVFYAQVENPECKDCMKSCGPLNVTLRQRRRALGLTLQAVSVQCGVPICTISRLERGTIDPHLSTLRRVLTVLGLPGGAFYAEDRRTTPLSVGESGAGVGR